MEAGLRLVDTGRPGALGDSSEAPPPAAHPTAPPGDDTPSSGGATFTLKGAAEACLVDPQTVRRRLKQLEQRGDLHGARRNDDGSWTIPLGALIAAGLKPGKVSPPDTPPDQPAVIPGHASPAHPDNSELIAELRARLDDKDVTIEELRGRVNDLRGNVEDLRRQLMPGKTTTTITESPSSAPAASAEPALAAFDNVFQTITPDVPAQPAQAVPSATTPSATTPPATVPKWRRLRRALGLQEQA